MAPSWCEGAPWGGVLVGEGVSLRLGEGVGWGSGGVGREREGAGAKRSGIWVHRAWGVEERRDRAVGQVRQAP